MILVYLRRREIPRNALLRGSPPPNARLVRVWDSPRERQALLADPEVLGVWGSYGLLEVPTEPEHLSVDKVIIDRRAS